MVVHQHHQNIQIISQNIMLNQIISSVDINVPLHIQDVPDILSRTNISTTSTSNITHPPKYERLHRNWLPEKELNKNWFHTRNI